MEFQDKILAMAHHKPLLPTEVGKALGKDSLIASAMLSAMVEKGLLKISHIKVGSSPLYYDPKHGEQLQNYVSYLNEKDRRIYEVLKEKKILREAALDPLSRVCVKNLKDFARPLEVSFGEKKEIFWKWYMLPDTEAAPLIKQLLNLQPESEPAPPPQPSPEPEPQPESEPAPEPKPELTPVEKPKSKSKPKSKKKETQKKIVDKIKEIIKKPKTIKGSDAFYKHLSKYFDKNKIRIIEKLNQKRKSEFEFIIDIQTEIGALTYYCHAKDKKRVGEADLSNAFVQGQLMKLPVLFLTTGNLTKQAEKMTEKFKGVAVRKI